MITILKIFSAVALLLLFLFALLLCNCTFEQCYYPGDPELAYPPFYYRVILPCRTWQFRKTILHGWYMNITGLYYDCASGHIYFYIWRDERYL